MLKINKNGFVMKQLVILIIPLLVLILIGVLLFPKFSPAIAGVSKLADFEDCDKDKVQNYFDKCPCIAAFGSEAEDLRGCPKGTSLNKSISDRLTCNWFITADPDKPVENCGKDNANGCVLDAEGNPKTRCGVVKESAIEYSDVSDASTEGIDSDAATVTSNLGFVDLKVYKVGEPNPELEFKRGEVKSLEHKGGIFAPIQISGTINNTGTVNIVNRFNIEVSVCNSAGSNCQRKNMYSSASTDSSGSPTGSPTLVYDFNGLNAGNSAELKKQYIFVGSQGDYCDGPEEKYECVVKLSIKGINDVDNSDNEISFVVHYQDQVYDPKFELRWYQLEFVTDDGSNGGFYDHFCERCNVEEARNKFYNRWGKHGGEYPSESSGDNCVVFACEDDDPYEDLGSGEVPSGTILSSKAEKISWTNPKGAPDAINGFEENTWKAQADGELVCYNSAWYWCSQSSENGLIVVGNDYFLCKNLQWIKRK